MYILFILSYKGSRAYEDDYYVSLVYVMTNTRTLVTIIFVYFDVVPPSPGIAITFQNVS